MMKIALIGAGQLGSRHLQALSQLEHDAHIQVVDPSADSLGIARSRFTECSIGSRNIRVTYDTSLSSLDNTIDYAVIATSSNVRRKVIDQLLAKSHVKNFLLEKILFQNIEDYAIVGDLFLKHYCSVWVNCPRRMFPGYQLIRSKLQNTEIMELNVYGSSWGLASNGIHIIDLFSFLSNSTEYTVSGNNLSNDIIQSKREGFIELNGGLSGKINTIPFKISSFDQGNIPLIIEIVSSSMVCVVREYQNKAFISHSENKWTWEESDFPVPFQSQLTNIAIQQIEKTGNCDLPTYEISRLLHEPLIKAFLEHLRSVEKYKDISNCPIT